MPRTAQPSLLPPPPPPIPLQAQILGSAIGIIEPVNNLIPAANSSRFPISSHTIPTIGTQNAIVPSTNVRLISPIPTITSINPSFLTPASTVNPGSSFPAPNLRFPLVGQFPPNRIGANALAASLAKPRLSVHGTALDFSSSYQSCVNFPFPLSEHKPIDHK